ncbi:hypothetical protein ABTX81_17400 [Kitasatospora sp. NPDC097605]|uniref:hypothetical protein n=1 Tax=Kitasatospora sp. NPDC097605 TaxID=3157226 RepID=UPI003328DC4A
MGDQHETHNRINQSTIYGNVFMGGILSLMGGRRPRLRLVIAALCAIALLGSSVTYWILGATNDKRPELSARYDPEREESDTSAVVPRVVKPTEPPAVTGCGDTRKWAHAQGGTDVGASPLSVSTVGNGHTVAIEQVRATIVGEPRDPMPGTIISCSAEGEGSKIEMGIDLDSPNPVALIGATESVSFAPYFTGKYLYLENQKPEILNLTVLAARHSYDYVLTVEGTIDGKRRTWTLKDGNRPFHISGVRGQRGTELETRGTGGWQTIFRKGSGERDRCNPCFDQDQKEIPGTAVSNAPAGYSRVIEPGIDPTRPLALPEVRPSLPTPPLTVDEYDAESVAVAWVLTSGSFDTSRGDTGRAAVLNRVRRYLTPELGAAGGELNACVPDDMVWPTDLVDRQGWSVVTYTSVGIRNGNFEPNLLTGDLVELRAIVHCTFTTESGWFQVPEPLPPVGLSLKRQPDGRYVITDLRR